MGNGYLKGLLTVDLTSGQIGEQRLDPALLRDYLGGSALAARLLYAALTPDLDPLSPAAPLLFMTGPLTGTSGPAVGRFTVCAKSPATALWGESNCGGFFGPELRFAGYDGLLITGAAPRPVYLWLSGGRAELRDAAHLWGQADVYETQARIKAEVGEPSARVAGIGLAGENLIPLAGILGDHGRLAGRTGMGAVMGSKNLKAVAVRGSGRIPAAREAEFKAARSAANVALRQDVMTSVLRDMGSSSGADYWDYVGTMPKRYFTRGLFENVSKVTGTTMRETIFSGVTTCHACVIACGRLVTISEGPYARPESKGPEYETLVGFGANLMIDDLAAVTHLGQLCDQYGLDTISASGTIGLAYLLFAEGLLTEKDTGCRLDWGDPRGAEQLIHAMARREKFGEYLALGARGLAEHFGAPDRAVQVNGLEVAYHDPRGATGMALVYATSPRGACHNQSDYFLVEMGQTSEEIGVTLHDRQAMTGKAASVARHQDWRTVGNALVICQFANVGPETVRELLNAETGLDLPMEALLAVGERAWNLKRAINNRLGLTRANDTLPQPLLTALPDGGAAGVTIDLPTMLAEYYQARGWDGHRGYPTRATLERLGLAFAADDLWGRTG